MTARFTGDGGFIVQTGDGTVDHHMFGELAGMTEAARRAGVSFGMFRDVMTGAVQSFDLWAEHLRSFDQTALRQLALDGTEVPVEESTRQVRATPGLSPAQRDVMRVLQRNGHIRPVEAGLILYAHMERTQADADRRSRYASADGSDMLRRMAKRGLVHWVSRGRWEAGPEQ